MTSPEIAGLLARLLDPGQNAETPSEFLGRQFDLGLAWVHFRAGDGGIGGSSALQQTVERAIVAAGSPVAFHGNPLGVGMVAPTIHDHGTQYQCQRLLRPLFTGEEVWCQLFSEPGAGSDLASVATSAVRAPDGSWVVNGAKVWTSYAHKAAWGLLLARTDPDQPKHKGLTMFLVEMSAPGVEIRPLYQMTGDAEFNEVFLNDVVVQDRHRLGAVGDGWRVVLTTLLNERVAIGGQVPARGEGLIGHLMQAWQDAQSEGSTRPELLDELMKLWIRAEALRLFNAHSAATRDDASGPGPEGWISKLSDAELNLELTSLALDVLGPAGLLKPDGYPLARSSRSPFDYAGVQNAFLRARANPIEGGTSEIARNVIGERLLRLPGEPRVDKDVAWSQVPRG
ncbi:MAG: Acyl-CoA dehydrogenase [Jatrophihabitans sp.]|nr:Acyl-CoA dehydrogenase [Jatrophihabitans sp.]